MVKGIRWLHIRDISRFSIKGVDQYFVGPNGPFQLLLQRKGSRPSIYLFIYLFIYLPVCLFVYLFVCWLVGWLVSRLFFVVVLVLVVLV